MLKVNNYQPHSYQQPVISLVKKKLMEKDRVLFDMATGLGKTITSAFIVEERLRRGEKGLFLCHENDILEQAQGEYRKIIPKATYKTFYGGNKDWDADQADMLFASFQSLNNHHGKWYEVFSKDHFDFMVVDEGHHAQAPTFKEVIDYFDCKKIGMTATPDRMDEKDIRDIFGKQVISVPLEEGIARGWLSKVEYHVLSDGLNSKKLTKLCREVLENNERVSIKQLNETIFIKARNIEERNIIEQYSTIQKHSQSKKTMIFCENINHAEKFAGYFEGTAGVVHSKQSDKVNHFTLEAFRNGDIQYLIAVDKLNEGIDVPDVEVVVFLRSTNSRTIWFQQLGRGLRRTALKNKVVVLDFVSNVERLIAIKNMVEKIKKSVGGELPNWEIEIEGDNFDFIFSDKMIDLLKAVEAIRKGFYLTWQEASIAAMSLGITSSTQYAFRYKEDLRLPSVGILPRRYPDFPGYTKFFNKDLAPKGWKTFKFCSEKLGVTKGTKKIKEILKEFKTEESKFFKMFWTPHKYTEYMHPEVFAKIKEYYVFREKNRKPKGWNTVRGLSSKKGYVVGPETIIELAEKYRLEHPEWFKMYWSNRGFLEHFSPDLCRRILEDIQISIVPKEGWKSSNMLSSEDGVIALSETIKEFTEKYKSRHPEWFKMYFTMGIKNNPVEYLGPELVALVYDEFGAHKRKIAPVGWVTPRQISREAATIGKTITIEKFAEKYRLEHPEWFKMYWLQMDFFEHYAPELVEIVRAEFSIQRRKQAPNGWLTANYIAKTTLGINSSRLSEKIRLFVESFREKKPEWLKKFHTAQGNKFIEHYHPILVKKVIKEFKK